MPRQLVIGHVGGIIVPGIHLSRSNRLFKYRASILAGKYTNDTECSK
jgi:pantothenate kinase type III